jgi:putative ABC transport system permease protein
MNIVNNIRVALRALRANMLRSSLTVLGIVIGVAAVVALLSIGRGATSGITDSVESMGTNLVTISSGRSFGPGLGGQSSLGTLLYTDYEKLAARISGIRAIAPYYSSMEQVTTTNLTSTYTVMGVTTEYKDATNQVVQSGRWLTSEDNAVKGRVVVIGADVATDLFQGLNPIGRKIKINNTQYEVVGVLESKGTSGFQSGDSNIFIPLATGYSKVFGWRATTQGKYTLSGITISAESADTVDSMITNIETVLRSAHNLSLSDDLPFNVSSQASILSSLSTISDTLSALLGAIAGISLLVGGIGIMNITLVSVTERTREIGLRKAVGAPQKAILFQFLVETMTLSILGGIIGILLGVTIASVVSYLGLITAKVTIDVLILSFTFSALIGLFFGIYPAYQASKLRPIEALRYE